MADRMRIVFALGMVLLALDVAAQHEHHHGMSLDADGMVMNENHDRLPEGCESVSAEVVFEVEGGARFAAERAGGMYGYSQHRYAAPPCSRITVTFHNRDDVRHHWMVHGLPRTLYPGGMFHIEAAGRASQKGTFIVPADDATYLVHCDVSQHMEKGMKAELVIGRGAGDLWAVPGVSAPFNRSDYLPMAAWLAVLAGALTSVVFIALWRWRRAAKRFATGPE